MSLLLSLILLAAMGAVGVAILRRVATFLELLELIAYGLPLGVVVASLLILLLADLFGLSAALVLEVGVASLVAALLLWPHRLSLGALRSLAPSRQDVAVRIKRMRHWTWQRGQLLPAAVIGAFALRWALLWSGALTYQPDGLWAGHINIWGDWTQHLGDTASFAYSDNFPPAHPRLVGQPFDYHFLGALTSAALVKVGLGLAPSLTLTSFLFSVLIALGLYAFACRLLRDRGAATLTLVLFLLGGSLGWLLVAGDINNGHNFLQTLLQKPWDQGRQEAANFRWHNIYFSFIMPQRGYLYGIPMALLICTLLLQAVTTHERHLFVAAGGVAGLLPFAHLSTLLALALIMPFLFLLFPSRGWVFFFATWVALAVPQLYVQQGGQRGATSAMRLQIGWVAPPDNWFWFWLKNLGWFLPLLGLALADRTLVPPVVRRFLWSFMPIFAIANIAVFQPWDWDNHKVLVFWFLAVCILVAALLAKAWRQYRSPIVRTLIGGTIATMIMSGILVNLLQLLGRDRYQLLTTEEVQLAAEVRQRTPPRAIFVVGLQNNHPVPVLTGRQVLMSFPGWLWTHGLKYDQTERDVRAIYKFVPDTPDLLRKYRVDYVVIGPYERDQLAANTAAYQARYPQIITTPNYMVFAVGQR